jgi:hypothetical protein
VEEDQKEVGKKMMKGMKKQIKKRVLKRQNAIIINESDNHKSDKEVNDKNS